MKKIFTLLILSFLSLQALELEWTGSYREALSLAKQENKSVMVLVTSESCGWCRRLERVTLKDADVIKRLNRDYILFQATRGEGTYPESFRVGAVPASLFLKADGSLIINKVIGFWSAEDYLSYLDDVDYKLGKKQY